MKSSYRNRSEIGLYLKTAITAIENASVIRIDEVIESISWPNHLWGEIWNSIIVINNLNIAFKPTHSDFLDSALKTE